MSKHNPFKRTPVAAAVMAWVAVASIPLALSAEELAIEVADDALSPVETLAEQAVLAEKRVVPVVEVAQAGTGEQTGDAAEGEGKMEVVTVTGTQIKGAAISDALSVSVVSAEDIEAMGLESGEELLNSMPEQGQNFFNEAETISGGVNSARGDIGAFNLRNIGTGNTLVLMNGRRVVNSATFQTEEVGGSFVPVNTANSAAIPLFGVERVEVLRDGASAIYGADAVAGVVNTVMRDDYDGFSIRGRWTDYEHFSRNNQSLTIEWGNLFNGGNTAVGVFANLYKRDRINSQDDSRWADSDFRRFLDPDSPWADSTAFRNDSANSNWGQFDVVTGGRNPYGLQSLGITDRNGEFETYPESDDRCSYYVAPNVCGAPDGQGTYRYNLNENRDLRGELDRYNVYGYFNHEFDSGLQFYSELHYYKSETSTFRHPSASFSSVTLRVGAENYYNPLGPCSSPNRMPEELIGTEVPCSGVPLQMDFYRLAEVPRIVDNDGETYRMLAGLRGTFGTDWDWDSAILYNKSEKDEVTHNRFSNLLLQEALNDPTPAAYNPFGAGVNTNYERAVVDVYRNSEADLKLIDFKVSNIGLFNTWAGPAGFVGGIEYREESFKDDRDPRLDGTIVFTDWQGDTYPFVSDVVNSSPTPDNEGSRDVTSMFVEFAVPLHATLDLQLALRYEDFSDVGSTTVPKVAFGWRPTDWFMLRGSWSEAFRAPNLITVNETIIARNNTNKDWLCQYLKDTTGMDDGLDGNCEYSWQRRASGSDNLKPEKSDNTSLGVVLTPTQNLTLTLDFWKIKKQDTIGLFGQDNIALEDLLFRVQAGNSNCGSVTGSPDLNRTDDVDDDALPLFEMAGLCPIGEAISNDDQYANLDTRKVEGYDFGVYYDIASRLGDWTLTWVGSVYTKYEQSPGARASVITDAQAAGIIPDNYPVAGLGDLMERNGNQETKMNARVRWQNADWAASVAWFYLSDFYDADLTLADGTRYVIPDHSYMNASVDYNFEIGSSDTRLRFGINNLTDERAPLADSYFGYWSDAHEDYGRSYYADIRVRF